MVLTVMLVVAILAGLAFSWITVHASSERLIVSFEIEKIWPVIDFVKAAAQHVFAREK